MFVETKSRGESNTTTPSHEGFIAWLRTKNPNEQYKFMNCTGQCALGQYMASIGISWAEQAYKDTQQAVFASTGGSCPALATSDTFGELLNKL